MSGVHESEQVNERAGKGLAGSALCNALREVNTALAQWADMHIRFWHAYTFRYADHICGYPHSQTVETGSTSNLSSAKEMNDSWLVFHLTQDMPQHHAKQSIVWHSAQATMLKFPSAMLSTCS